MTSIEDLPDEILQEIFLHCDYATFLKLWRVCKRWCAVYIDKSTLRRAFSLEQPPHRGKFIVYTYDGFLRGPRLPTGQWHGMQVSNSVRKYTCEHWRGQAHGIETFYRDDGSVKTRYHWVHGKQVD